MLLFALTVAPFLGFYDGFFGPGTGSLIALAFILYVDIVLREQLQMLRS